jgi:outer membrane protein assembly factor BamB
VFSLVASSYVAVGAPVLQIKIAVDKQVHYLGDGVSISANVTVNGNPMANLAAIELDNPGNMPYLIRTVETGNVSKMYFRVQISSLYTCNSQGVSQTVFNPGQTAYVNIVFKNIDTVQRSVTIGLYAQASDNTPLGARAYYTSLLNVAPGGVQQSIVPFLIVDNASYGQGTVFVSLFSDYVWNGGHAYCPEQTVDLSISTSTPVMPMQPQYFNVTFNLPKTGAVAGTYTIHAATYLDEGYQTGTDTKQFAVVAPVPIATYSPQNPIVCQAMTFDGSTSHGVNGSYISDWYWIFDDGATADGKIVKHAYRTAGSHTTSLRVTDNHGGSNTTSLQIFVTEAWPTFHHDPQHSGASTSLSPVTNSVLWSQSIGPNVNGIDSLMYSSVAALPPILGNVVFTGSTNGIVYAFDATSGAYRWASPSLGGGIHSSPTFVDSLIFVGCDNGHVYGLDATNGKVVYDIPTSGAVYSSPAVSDGIVYVGSTDGNVYALNASTGALAWNYRTGSMVESSPAVAGGRVFVGSSNGNVHALNAATGAFVWSYKTGSAVYSSPVVASGRVFVGSEDHRVYALDASTGGFVWSYLTGDSVRSSPAVVDGMVFVGSMDGNLYALDASTGTLDWTQAVGPISWSSPLLAEGKVFVGTTDGKICALREVDGETFWSYQTNGAVDSSPALLNEVVYACSKDGNLYAFYGQVHDVAVRSVVPSKTSVFQDEPITISVDLWNKGSFDETVNLATSNGNSPPFNQTSIPLTRGRDFTVQIPFVTTGLAPGTYMISTSASIFPNVDDFPSDNIGKQSITIVTAMHDVGITNVTSSKTVIGQGYTGNITIFIQNKGNYSENVETSIYAGSSMIASWNLNNLLAGNSAYFIATWNTTYFVYGNYTLSAYALPVPGETNTVDNNCTCSIPIHVGVSGDVSSVSQGVPDGTVSMRDISYFIYLYNTQPKSPQWNANADVNNDGIINMRDIAIAIFNFMKHE